VIRIYEMDKLIADVDLRNGKLQVRSYDGDWVVRSLESLRRPNSMTDEELYNSLPRRLSGRIWAGYAKN
jgi:hypothetical protein